MTLPTIPTSNKLSLYQDGTITKDGIANALAKVKAAFPKIENSQLNMLREMFKTDNFSDQKALDAVYHVIRTYEGWDKVPNIANFLQYDKTYLTYAQALEIGLEHCEIADKDRKLWKRK